MAKVRSKTRRGRRHTIRRLGSVVMHLSPPAPEPSVRVSLLHFRCSGISRAAPNPTALHDIWPCRHGAARSPMFVVAPGGGPNRRDRPKTRQSGDHLFCGHAWWPSPTLTTALPPGGRANAIHVAGTSAAGVNTQSWAPELTAGVDHNSDTPSVDALRLRPVIFAITLGTRNIRICIHTHVHTLTPNQLAPR